MEGEAEEEEIYPTISLFFIVPRYGYERRGKGRNHLDHSRASRVYCLVVPSRTVALALKGGVTAPPEAEEITYFSFLNAGKILSQGPPHFSNTGVLISSGMAS
jgi:hypothetical protein